MMGSSSARSATSSPLVGGAFKADSVGGTPRGYGGGAQTPPGTGALGRAYSARPATPVAAARSPQQAPQVEPASAGTAGGAATGAFGGFSLKSPDCGVVVAPDALPDVWVTRWVDYSAKYGVVYQMPDGSIGVYFNDSTKALCAADGASFDYITRSTVEQPAVRSTHTFDDYPADLQKKVTLLRHFRSCMANPDSIGRRDGATSGGSNLPENKAPRGNSQVYVRKWSRRGSAMMFQLSNKDIQVVFFDGTEVVLSSRAHMVTYSDKSSQTQSWALSRALDDPGPELARRLRYILSNLLDVPAADLPKALQA